MLKIKPETTAFVQKLVVQMAIIVCVGALLGLGFNQCRSQETKVALMDTSVFVEEELTDEAVTQELVGLNPITPDTAYAKSKLKPVVFVDSRHPIEFGKGHIKDAVNVPYEDFMDYMDEFLNAYPPETILIVYCDGKNCEQSEHLGQELVYAGYETVYYMEPNWLNWLNSGKPVTIH